MKKQIAQLPKPYLSAIKQIKALENHQRYIGAFIFGSVARGDITKNSDIDIKVVVNGKTHDSVNHPFINGIKCDISFNSLETIISETKAEIKNRKRIPMIAESIIIFDKTGELHALRRKAKKVKPKKLTKAELLMVEYFIYNEDAKVKRFLNSDPHAALLVMHMGLQFILELYYKANRKWFVSSKRIFKDLAIWDPDLVYLVRDFINISEINSKFLRWSTIIDYITKPLGGRKPVEENNCNCLICNKDLSILTKGKH